MNIVLVPGVNHGGWCWYPVGQRMRAAGHAVHPLTLPGLAMGDDPAGLRLADAVDFIVSEVERRDLRDVVLVGHSAAGIPITGAAPRIAGRLAHVAFFSGFIPRRGESMADALGPETAAWMRATAAASPDGTIPIDFTTFSTRLMQDEPVALQRLVFDQLTPQPGGYVLESLDVDGLDTLGVPITYLLAERDIALAAPGAEPAARLGVTPIMVPGTHEAMLTHPDEVAAALLRQITRG
ncbi:alpha/beta fold hydrolase [Catenuloplanes atrovinosus]|uniref:Pimeloyl-ACP methyl ester carboxylesterase n=1 Tax=Catenuloplanes atrovinosus TaxID=137266 RepID=A0AAE3YMJ6_9ACTN|nr:alpha/beta fold hydrolase [Catenuloplanes atrovinosus]MDR7275230.1 pimeloyl-ACP methyl ester carboxylesterase [Catenuloplanes atrovinosus]